MGQDKSRYPKSFSLEWFVTNVMLYKCKLFLLRNTRCGAASGAQKHWGRGGRGGAAGAGGLDFDLFIKPGLRGAF